MIKSIVEYVNFYFPTYKTQFYSDNFIKACLVYQFLYAKYFSQKLDIDQIIYRLTEARNYLNSDSDIIKNHLIFNLAFKAFWKDYRIGRGCVYVTLHRILMLKVKARARHAFTLKQKNLF